MNRSPDHKMRPCFNKNEPTEIAVIRQVENELVTILPADYVDFLLSANGGEGFIGESYVILWRVEELLKLNRAYEVDQYVPEFLLFGSDGGGDAFAFDCREDTWKVVRVPFIGMDYESALPMGNSFSEFLDLLSQGIDGYESIASH